MFWRHILRNIEQEPQEIVELFEKRPTVIRPGLSRVTAALAYLEQPSKSIPKVVVGGTNGKGTTCGIAWRLLAAAGLRVGLFTSPHLEEFRERITISNYEVTQEDIVQTIAKLRQKIPASLWNDLTFFEINTILAFMIFDAHRVDVAVLEVGLGGRLDCVNVYDPDVAVITSIGLDHTEFLGDTVEKIAYEKSGIMRRHRPCIWGGGESSAPEAHRAIIESAAKHEAVLIDGSDLPTPTWPSGIRSRPSFIRQNFKIAAEAVRQLINQRVCAKLNGVQVSDLINQFDGKNLPLPVTFKGRFDAVKVSKGNRSFQVILDVCHNPHGAKALANALQEFGIASPDNRRHCLISVLSDKDVTGIWNEIHANISQVVKFKINSPRSWEKDDSRILGESFESFSDAWARVIEDLTWQKNQPWLVFGSVAAVGEVFKFWRMNHWKIERIAIT